MKDRKVIGIIGCGSIGSRHATNLLDMGHTVMLNDPELTVRGQPCSSAHDILSQADGVVITSPTSLHNKHIDQYGDKPLFVEKPIADKLPVDISSIVMVGYNLRYHSCVKKAKEWIDGGLVGRPLWANFTLGQYNNKPAYLRDGVITNWSHEIDLALYLLGPWGLCGSSTRLSDGRDDITDILLNQSGCRTSIHLDYVTQPEVRQSIIVGDKATIIMDLVHRHAWLRATAFDESDEGVIFDMHEGKDSWDMNYIEEMQAFLDRLDGKETIGCTGAEGLEVMKICMKVREAAGL